MKPKIKWKFAIGTTSCVPHSTLHYLIADVDAKMIRNVLSYMVHIGVRSFEIQQTKRGWHVYTNLRLSWRRLLRILRLMPDVDKQWVKIGAKRGYLYLADKAPVVPSWPVVRMVLSHGKAQKHAR